MASQRASSLTAQNCHKTLKCDPTVNIMQNANSYMRAQTDVQLSFQFWREFVKCHEKGSKVAFFE